jgi:hypothetical protein
VAEEAKSLLDEEMRALSPAERVRIAFGLGERDLLAMMAATGLTREEAMKRIRATRRAGRRPSKCMDE